MASLRNLMIRLGIDYDDTGSNKLSKGLDRLSTRITKTSSAMDKMRTPALAVGMASAAGAATSAAAALAPLAASAVALPAAFAASKAAAATLRVGLTGMGDAMSAVAEGDAKKLNEALKNLSPEAQKFVRASSGFTKQFDPIRRAVQDRLFDGLSSQIGPVAKNLLPSVRKGMLGVAGSFNKGALEAAKFGQSSLAKGALNTVFKTTKSVLNEASTAVRPFLSAVARLVQLGAPLAQRMSSWAINGVKAGSAFVNSERGAAKLASWAQRAGDMLAQLGRIGGNLARGLGGVFSQANANSSDFLGTLERLTAKFAAWANSAAGQQQAANAFKLLGDVARQLATVLPLLIGPLGALAKLITSLPPDVQGTVTTMLAFGVVAGALGGKLALLGGVLVKSVSLTTQFAGGLAKGSAALGNKASAAAKAGGALRTWGSTMAQGVVHSSALLGNLTKNAAATALNTTRTIASTVAQKAAAVASKALAIAVRLVNAAMRANPIGLIITLITGLIAIIVVAYKKNETFRKIVDAVWKGIQNAIKFAWNNVIKPVFEWIRNFIVNTLGPKFMWFHRNVVQPAMTKIGEIVRTVIEKVKTHFMFMHRLVTQTIPNAFKSGVAAIGRFWDKVKEIAKRPVSFVVNTVYNNGIRKVWNWIADKVGMGQLSPITGFARGGVLPGYSRKDDQLIMARSGEGILVPEAVKALGKGFIHQTNAAARNGGARNVAKTLGIAGDPGGLNIPGFAEGGIVGLVKGFFAKAKNHFLDGVVKAVRGVTDPLIAMTQRSIGGTGIGSLITAAVRKIVDGVIGKIKGFETQLGGGGGMGAVKAARSQIGVPYSWGGGGPGGPSLGIGRGANTVGFDCSGLTEYAWHKATGKSIGGTTFEQIRLMKRIPGPRPGAVGQPHINHTYMATERGTIIEAPYTGARVREVGMRHTPTWLWPAFKFDNGGILEPGMVGVNKTREPEAVFNASQWRKFEGGTGDTIIVHNHIAPGAADVRKYEESVYRAFVNYKKRNRGTRE